MISIKTLEGDVKSCSHCSEHLPLGPRPIIQIDTSSKILIAGQARVRKFMKLAFYLMMPVETDYENG